MSREKEGFRDNLERLDQKFPNTELLNVQDLVNFTGRDRRTVKDVFPFSKNYISKVEAARTLSN